MSLRRFDWENITGIIGVNEGFRWHQRRRSRAELYPISIRVVVTSSTAHTEITFHTRMEGQKKRFRAEFQAIYCKRLSCYQVLCYFGDNHRLLSWTQYAALSSRIAGCNTIVPLWDLDYFQMITQDFWKSFYKSSSNIRSFRDLIGLWSFCSRFYGFKILGESLSNFRIIISEVTTFLTVNLLPHIRDNAL